METVYTPEIWITLLTPIIIILILMFIKQPKTKEAEEQQENIDCDAVYNQLVESDQNIFM